MGDVRYSEKTIALIFIAIRNSRQKGLTKAQLIDLMNRSRSTIVAVTMELEEMGCIRSRYIANRDYRGGGQYKVWYATNHKDCWYCAPVAKR